MGSRVAAPSAGAIVTRLKRDSILLLKRSVTRAGACVRTASAAGTLSTTMAWAAADPGPPPRHASPSTRATAVDATAPGRDRVTSAPVVEHQARGVLVIVLLAPLHPHHREIDVVPAFE